MRVSGGSSLKYLCLGVAVSGTLALSAGSAFAYSSTGSTTVTSSTYQANSAYAQSVGTQQATGAMAPAIGQSESAAMNTYPAQMVQTVPQPMPAATVQADNTVYTNGYSGPMGPNAQKAFEVGQQASAAPQAAEPTYGPNVIHNPQQIQSCLCLQINYEMLNNDRTSKDTAYNQAAARRADLDTQIATAKASPSSPEQIERIRELSAKRIELQHQINQQYIPDLQASTMHYNSVVGEYQQSCADKEFDGATLARVKTGLVCQGS